jgi:hypothetical protein
MKEENNREGRKEQRKGRRQEEGSKGEKFFSLGNIQ